VFVPAVPIAVFWGNVDIHRCHLKLSVFAVREWSLMTPIFCCKRGIHDHWFRQQPGIRMSSLFVVAMASHHQPYNNLHQSSSTIAADKRAGHNNKEAT
jgi:hypothetical protein